MLLLFSFCIKPCACWCFFILSVNICVLVLTRFCCRPAELRMSERRICQDKETVVGTRRTDGGAQTAEPLQTDSFCRSPSCLIFPVSETTSLNVTFQQVDPECSDSSVRMLLHADAALLCDPMSRCSSEEASCSACSRCLDLLQAVRLTSRCEEGRVGAPKGVSTSVRNVQFIQPEPPNKLHTGATVSMETSSDLWVVVDE